LVQFGSAWDCALADLIDLVDNCLKLDVLANPSADVLSDHAKAQFDTIVEREDSDTLMKGREPIERLLPT
jgi:hypothetical protein